MTESVLDIYDSTILDARPVTRDEIMNMLNNTSRAGICNAVSRGNLPPPADHDGPRGQARWFVGQLRKWNARKCEEAICREEARSGRLRKSLIPDPDLY